ncbi:hypothetical protein BGW38_006843, partial [Lunasporangiospora selenospora]
MRNFKSAKRHQATIASFLKDEPQKYTSPFQYLAKGYLTTRLPNEILHNLSRLIDDPLSLEALRKTCRLFFYLIDDRLWFKLYLRILPRWSKGACYSDLTQLDLGNLAFAQGPWRARVLHDNFLRSTWSVDTTLRKEASKIAGRNLTKGLPGIAPDQSDRSHTELTSALEIPDSSLRIPIERAFEIHPDAMTPGGWQNIGPPVSNSYHEIVKNAIRTSTIMAYMQAHIFNKVTEHQVIIYQHPNYEIPLATIDSQAWKAPDSQGQEWCYPFEPAQVKLVQVMDIKHFPDQLDDQGRMRVILVLAFGEGSGNLEGSEDVGMLDFWLLIKVIELYIDVPSTTIPCTDLLSVKDLERSFVRTNIHTIQPTVRVGARVRGRMVKLFTFETSFKRPCDFLAVFGITSDDRGVVFKEAIFTKHPPMATRFWSNTFQPIGEKITCMTLFPAQSAYEHLMVVFTQQGTGLVWDWVNNKHIFYLGYGAGDQSDQPTVPSVHVSPQQPQLAVENELTCWGVQVNWAIEEPDRLSYKNNSLTSIDIQHRKKGALRVVTMFDGQQKEWASCWWHLDETDLNKYMRMSEQRPAMASKSLVLMNTGKSIGKASFSTAYGREQSKQLKETGLLSSLSSSFCEKDVVESVSQQFSPQSSTPQPSMPQSLTSQPSIPQSLTPQPSMPQPSTLQPLTPQPLIPQLPTLQSLTGPEKIPCHYPMSTFFSRHTIGHSVRIPPGQGLVRRKGLAASNTPKGTLQTSSENIKNSSIDRGVTPESGNTLYFVAYLLWDHYRISLTSEYGLCCVDIELEGNEKHEEPRAQWVTYLEDADRDPLVDIATIADRLYITR